MIPVLNIPSLRINIASTVNVAGFDKPRRTSLEGTTPNKTKEIATKTAKRSDLITSVINPMIVRMQITRTTIIS